MSEQRRRAQPLDFLRLALCERQVRSSVREEIIRWRRSGPVAHALTPPAPCSADRDFARFCASGGRTEHCACVSRGACLAVVFLARYACMGFATTALAPAAPGSPWSDPLVMSSEVMLWLLLWLLGQPGENERVCRPSGSSCLLPAF